MTAIFSIGYFVQTLLSGREFLRQYFRQNESAAQAENTTTFRRRFQRLLDKLAALPEATRHRAELARTESLLAALLGLHWPDSLHARQDALGRYHNTQIALSHFIQALCLRRPLALELEDGHWFDPATRAFLPRLLQEAADLPLLLIITSRYHDVAMAIGQA